MTKEFCDICSQDITGLLDYVRVSAVRFSNYRLYCTPCFLEKKNWKVIHTFPKEKPNPIREAMRKQLKLKSI